MQQLKEKSSLYFKPPEGSYYTSVLPCISSMEFSQSTRRVPYEKKGLWKNFAHCLIEQLSFQGLGGAIESGVTDNRLLVQYTYHLHGWLKEVKAIKMSTVEDHTPELVFRETLTYEDHPQNPRFDGNITQAQYVYHTDVDVNVNGYNYIYDELNRLRKAISEPSDSDKDAIYTYYDDGRIESIDRGGRMGLYNYYDDPNPEGDNSGRLKNVDNAVPNVPFVEERTLDGDDLEALFGVREAFEYDDNGNMVLDRSKTKDGKDFKVTYRSDNLPSYFDVTVRNEQTGDFEDYKMYMIYNGAGSRVSKITFKNENPSSTKSYFNSGKEVRELFGEETVVLNQLAGIGRVEYSEGNAGGKREVYLKDHLGTTREVYNPADGEIKYAYQYFPYGKVNTLADDGTDVTEKYTGKEKDENIGLSYFGARFYDHDLGVWAVADPGRQFHNPYNYTGNGINPIIGVDRGGKDVVVYSRWVVIGGKPTGFTHLSIAITNRANNLPNVTYSLSGHDPQIGFSRIGKNLKNDVNAMKKIKSGGVKEYTHVSIGNSQFDEEVVSRLEALSRWFQMPYPLAGFDGPNSNTFVHEFFWRSYAIWLPPFFAAVQQYEGGSTIDWENLPTWDVEWPLVIPGEPTIE